MQSQGGENRVYSKILSQNIPINMMKDKARSKVVDILCTINQINILRTKIILDLKCIEYHLETCHDPKYYIRWKHDQGVKNYDKISNPRKYSKKRRVLSKILNKIFSYIYDIQYL